MLRPAQCMKCHLARRQPRKRTSTPMQRSSRRTALRSRSLKPDTEALCALRVVTADSGKGL